MVNKILKKFVLCIFIVFLLFIATIFTFNRIYAIERLDSKIYCNANINDDFADNRVLIVLNKEASIHSDNYSCNNFLDIDCLSVKELTEDYQMTDAINKEKYYKVLCLELKQKSKENVLHTIDKLMKRNDVIYAGPDYKLTLSSSNSTEELEDIQWAIENLELPEVWKLTTGNDKVLVGIIDSGIDGTHPDLADSIVRDLCRDFTSGEEVEEPNPTDSSGHGTHVAGIIGAIGDNSIGVLGCNWNVGLVSLKVSEINGSCYSSNVVTAIQYAKTKNIPILNLSLAWDSNDDSYDLSLETIINSYNGTIICSAGNAGKNNDIDGMLPASINLPNIISVGSIDSSNNRSIWSNSSSSNYGELSVDIYAPGSDILSTFPENVCERCNQKFSDGTLLCEIESYALSHIEALMGAEITFQEINDSFEEMFDCSPSEMVATIHQTNGYHYSGGTSMAAPYVTGVAALLLSINPDLVFSQLKEAIIYGSDDIQISIPSSPIKQSVKKLNAYKAVKYMLDNSPTSSFELSNYSSTFNEEIEISSGGMKCSRLDIKYSKYYELNFFGNQKVDVRLYDTNFNQIEFADINSLDNAETIIMDLNIGTYYVIFENQGDTDIFNIEITSRDSQYLTSLETHDILLNYKNGINIYYYKNNYGIGFYDFVLTGVKSNGDMIICSEGAVTIKNANGTNIIKKFDITDYQNQAINEEGNNTVTAFLYNTGYFSIQLSINEEDLVGLRLQIKKTDNYQLDLFELLEHENNKTVFINSKNYLCIEEIKLLQDGIFDLEVLYDGNQESIINFALYKPIYNEILNTYTLTKIFESDLSSLNSGTTMDNILMSEGLYYCYYNGESQLGSLTFTLTRDVGVSNINGIVSDPTDMFTYNQTCGSMINIYEKNIPSNERTYSGTTIVKGFTRVVYLETNVINYINEVNPNYDYLSRSSYNWYSSNSEVLSVSSQGTVFGKRPGTVEVLAVHKNDPSIFFAISFIVINDPIIYSEPEIYAFEDSHKLTEGDYLIGLTVQNAPYPSIKLYTWKIKSQSETITSIIIKENGFITIEGTGSIIIQGYNYYYNSNYIIEIELTVIN